MTIMKDAITNSKTFLRNFNYTLMLYCSVFAYFIASTTQALSQNTPPPGNSSSEAMALKHGQKEDRLGEQSTASFTRTTGLWQLTELSNSSSTSLDKTRPFSPFHKKPCGSFEFITRGISPQVPAFLILFQCEKSCCPTKKISLGPLIRGRL
jgi:hypothetical protein